MPSKQLTTQWKKIGINKCKNKEGKIDYNKLSKLYLSLIAKELNNSKKENNRCGNPMNSLCSRMEGQRNESVN